MKTPRLIPVVIAATTALLLFKGIGLFTSGGYVLIGTAPAIAAGGGGGGGGEAKEAGGADPSMTLPAEPTLEDTSPTLDDGAVTLPLGSEPAAGGGGHGAAPAEGAEAEGGEAASAGEHGAEAPEAAAIACPPGDEAAEAPKAEEGGGEGKGEVPGLAAAPLTECGLATPVNEYGDALPLVSDGAGGVTPLADSTSSEADVLERLGERRETLDSREKELEMRMALVEAAEKRLDERTAALKELEAKINALVDQQKSAEKEQFAGIVQMYETMKPKEAAVIFNELDMNVLLQVARAMNPRKMAPILAKMDPVRANVLTAGLAQDEVQPQVAAADDLSSLPQIVGQ